MKIRYLITGLLVSAFAVVSCAKPDTLITTDSDVSNLVVSGFFPSDKNKTAYPSVVDMAAKTITVQIPWFMSDTEPIQADLSEMTLTATLPWGTVFEPGLSGICDLQTGIQRTLVYNNGTSTDFTIKAVYVKSNRAQVTKIAFPDAPNVVTAIKAPETEGGKGTIVVFVTGATDFMQSATIGVSPWASFTTTAPKNPDGTYDMSGDPTITVTAQDGSVQTYGIQISIPAFVPYGKMGYISLLFGFQTTVADPHGFTEGDNRSMAIIGSYLILNSVSQNKFPVFNRFTGKLLTDVEVNVTGLPTGIIHAITNDDAGHLVAVTYAANLKTDVSSNQVFDVYVWKNGITSAPTRVFTGNVAGTSFADWRTGNNALSTANAWEIGRVVSVKGDITSGTAMLMSFANAMAGSAMILRMQFIDGAPQPILKGSIRGLSSWGVRSKAIPLSVEDAAECSFVTGSGNWRRRTVYAPTGAGVAILYFEPGGDWWGTGTIATDYVEFNGLKLVATQNVNGTDNPLRSGNCRLCISNIDGLASGASITSGNAKIFDSRLDNYDPVAGETGPGKGNNSVTGMTAGSPFVSGETILGPNNDLGLMNATVNVGATGDVRFGKSEDGSGVQVYMLTTDNGIIAYELTRYDI